MSCYHPLSAYRTADGQIVFREKGHIIQALKLPCGQCVGCRLDRSRQWAVRCVHEASLYSKNCFITLTYNNDHLPRDLSLDVEHFQLFFKRLRKKYGKHIRYFHCGEYGELTKRPHYHACIFNFDFPDKKIYTIRDGIPLYISAILESIWGKGFCTIGDVTFESAAYVARYIMKKITGDAAQSHYAIIDESTGEVLGSRKPEYTTMSRRPGIGYDWFQKYKDDVYPHDRVVIRGKVVKPPKYYDSKYEIIDPVLYDRVKYERHLKGQLVLDDNTQDRLDVKERCKLESLKLLPRNL